MKLMKRRRKKLAHFGPFVGKCFYQPVGIQSQMTKTG
jgi:hypothetical protein